MALPHFWQYIRFPGGSSGCAAGLLLNGCVAG
jgi:hypothetical protein